MRKLIKSGLRRLATPQNPVSNRPLGHRNARVIAIAAEKGGVGKTTTCVSLAAALARYHQKKVLLIDLDPQGHVATALKAQTCVGGGPLSEVLTDETSELDVIDVATHTDVPNLYVTPLDPNLRNAEDLIGTRMGKEFLLRDALRVARTHYDAIMIDCPPNLGNLSVNGLVAADEVLIPCDPSPLALNGVHALIQTISTISMRLNPEIDVTGILMTRVDGRNTKLNQAIRDDIESRYGDAVLPVQIGISSSLSKAQMAGKDVFAFDARSRGAEQYKELASLLVEQVLEDKC
jgi:chromosome partitioning protein